MKHMNKDELRAHGDTLPLGSTRDANGRVLTCKTNTGRWSEYTRDAHGQVLTFKDSNGYWSEYTRDAHGQWLSYKNSDGDWSECTRDANGNELTYKNSYGYWRGVSNEEIDKERARLKQVRKNLKRSKK